MSLKQKPMSAQKDNVKKVFSLLSYRQDNPIVMGSAGIKNVNHPADFDLFEVVYTSANLTAFQTHVAKGFQKLFSRLQEAKSYVYFIDFKCGLQSNGKPLRWTIPQVINNNNGGRTLQSCFNEKSIVKIDVVAFLDGQLVPFSNVFEFRFSNGKGINREAETRDSVESLGEDAEKYLKKGNYWKATKRVFVISQVLKKEKLIAQLLNIFNSDLGKISKTMTDIEAMVEVLDAGYSGTEVKNQIKSSLQISKSLLATVSTIPISDSTFKSFNQTFSKRGLKRLHTSLNTVLQKWTKRVVSANPAGQ